MPQPWQGKVDPIRWWWSRVGWILEAHTTPHAAPIQELIRETHIVVVLRIVVGINLVVARVVVVVVVTTGADIAWIALQVCVELLRWLLQQRGRIGLALPLLRWWLGLQRLPRRVRVLLL